MLNFCTLFDSNYAAKGLAMYQSLIKTCTAFHLYIFAFDDKLEENLIKMNLPHISVISLKDFEDEELLAVKPSRTMVEYCWTTTPSTILYCITKYNLDHCTYLDADLYFFSNPKVLIDEMGDCDVLITPHRYSKKYDQTLTSGKYCVQFNTFKNTENGLDILIKWRNDCIDWCFNRYEDGKRGDQMYLDKWSEIYNGVHELEHLGGGVAPWNMQQYKFIRNKQVIQGIELTSNKQFNLIFFHFHYMFSVNKSFFREFSFDIYELPESIHKIVYIPYLKFLIKSYRFCQKYDENLDGLATKQFDKSWFAYFKIIRKRYINNNKRFLYWIG
jgi:hypothetical protein